MYVGCKNSIKNPNNILCGNYFLFQKYCRLGQLYKWHADHAQKKIYQNYK
jgi:hypothetical protein